MVKHLGTYNGRLRYKYPPDPTIERVINLFKSRADEGMIKYETSMTGNKGDMLYWCNNLQEELMDSIAYLERIKQELENGK
jgi:hypothetical protein|tara:strand:- start:242 stop:484 length:243 start_codon:yes stop_codon:yes gene_type:complete